MKDRQIQKNRITDLLEQFPAVAILGPRQVGKTTMALEIAEKFESVYLDLESESDLTKLENPEFFLKSHKGKLIIIDEVQSKPNLFKEIRGIIDEFKREGKKHGHFLLLGSASLDLLKQSGESLAGRIAYTELTPFNTSEFPESMDKLWLRGGFPDSTLANSDEHSLIWRQNFIKTYLERDIPQLGPRIPSETLRRFWTMLAHLQGSLVNASQIAKSLGTSSNTVASYLDLMTDLMLVRRLEPFHTNTGKRLIKSPKIYVRDSGLVHSLLKIRDMDELLGHPIAGNSWEGFIVEQILNECSIKMIPAYFYRTSNGNELDIILQIAQKTIWSVEIKRSSAPKLSRGNKTAMADLNSSQNFIIYPGKDTYHVNENTQVLYLEAFLKILQQA